MSTPPQVLKESIAWSFWTFGTLIHSQSKSVSARGSHSQDLHASVRPVTRTKASASGDLRRRPQAVPDSKWVIQLGHSANGTFIANGCKWAVLDSKWSRHTLLKETVLSPSKEFNSTRSFKTDLVRSLLPRWEPSPLWEPKLRPPDAHVGSKSKPAPLPTPSFPPGAAGILESSGMRSGATAEP